MTLNASNENARSYSSVHTPFQPFVADLLTRRFFVGSGESGKSTIVKQMKIIHKEGFTDAELAEYRPIVYKNVLDSAQAVIIYMRKIGWDFDGYSNRVCSLFLILVQFILIFFLFAIKASSR